MNRRNFLTGSIATVVGLVGASKLEALTPPEEKTACFFQEQVNVVSQEIEPEVSIICTVKGLHTVFIDMVSVSITREVFPSFGSIPMRKGNKVLSGSIKFKCKEHLPLFMDREFSISASMKDGSHMVIKGCRLCAPPEYNYMAVPFLALEVRDSKEESLEKVS